jgi:carbamoyl-phosphate synthase large subunit
MRILLTGAGGPSAISIWKSLRVDHEIHMADMDPAAAGLYLVPPERRLILPRGDDPRLVPLLLEVCRARSIDVLVPTVDAEFVPIALAAGAFAALPVALPIAPLECLRLCRDKHALLTHLEGRVPLPAFELLTEESARRAAAFPLFAKPRAGAGSRGATTIRSPADLAGLPMDGSYLLQEFLPGTEYSVDVYVRGDGRIVAAVPRERMKTDSGIAVTARTVHVQDVIDVAIRVASEIGVRYVANIQFKRGSDGVPKLLEVNPRFPGTLPLTTEAGVDIPKLMLDEIAGKAMPDKLLPFKEVMVVRYWTEHFFDAGEWKDLCRP